MLIYIQRSVMVYVAFNQISYVQPYILTGQPAGQIYILYILKDFFSICFHKIRTLIMYSSSSVFIYDFATNQFKK